MNNIPETRQSLLLNVADPSNQQAWEEFVELYQPVVYRVAVSRGLQDADALDLVQTVFVSIAGAIAEWSAGNPKQRFRHWLLRVAKNATINAVTRKPIVQRQAGIGNEDLLEQIAAVDRHAETLLELEYKRELFMRASQMVRVDVSADSWKAFELTAIHGLSKEAAASELGKSIGTIYAARSRVMKRLCEAVANLESSYR